MADRTQAQLVARALQKLKVVGSGMTASAEDTQLVTAVVGPVMSSLAKRQIFSWGDKNALPEEAFEHLADCVAHASAGDFGKSYNPDVADASPMPDRFERRLRSLDLYQLSGQTLKTVYY